jgi:hypothetical protein
LLRARSRPTSVVCCSLSCAVTRTVRSWQRFLMLRCLRFESRRESLTRRRMSKEDVQGSANAWASPELVKELDIERKLREEYGREPAAEVHGGRSMHGDTRRTWLVLNKLFPEHRFPYRWIEEKVAACSVCQLYRRGLENYVEEIVSHLKPSRTRVG